MAETKTTRTRKTSSDGISSEERAAMREFVRESRKGKRSPEEDEAEVLAKIAEMDGPDRDMAERLHALIKKTAPELAPRTWYGMPAYAKNGNVICFFQNAGKFKARYGTLGFSDKANLDDGNMWPSSYALMKLTAADEKRIAELVKQAVS